MSHAFLPVVIALLLASSVHAQSCSEYQAIPSLGGEINVVDVSDDGQVVVGTAFPPSGTPPGTSIEAFRWTATTGVQLLGTLPGEPISLATAVSADGSTIVGYSGPGGGIFGNRAFRWTSTGGMQDLGTLSTFAPETRATAVSGDGSVIVGMSFDGQSFAALHWTAATGMRQLASFPNGSSIATAVSADGATVLLNSGSNGGPGVPVASPGWRWTAATGLVPLGLYDLVGLSSGGDVIIGTRGSGGNGRDSYRWTNATGWVLLPRPPTSDGTFPKDISQDGRVVVGNSFRAVPPFGPFVYTPVRWTVEEGMTELGIAAGPGPNAWLTGVSGDGTFLVGDDMSSPDGFRVRVSSLGESYCRPAVANSGSCAGVLLVAGDPVAATGALQLTAELLPLHTAGFFLASRAQALVSGPAGSQGNLCLGGAIGRFVGPGHVMNSGSSGTFSLSVDLAQLPTPSGLVSAQPGETWNFQAWYRDANPGPTSNFSDAVSVTLQ